MGGINMAIRSGRFKSARTIIKGRADTFFRILNSAEFHTNAPDTNKIKVTFGSGANDFAFVLPTFSLDFFARDDVSVEGAAVVEGIYDSLPNEDVKSGRFKTKGTMDATAGVKIISAGTGNSRAIYRIFNSGPVALKLVKQNANGMGTVAFDDEIAENESYDFVTEANKVILVKGVGGASDHIEGIYNFVGKV